MGKHVAEKTNSVRLAREALHEKALVQAENQWMLDGDAHTAPVMTSKRIKILGMWVQVKDAHCEKSQYAHPRIAVSPVRKIGRHVQYFGGHIAHCDGCGETWTSNTV